LSVSRWLCAVAVGGEQFTRLIANFLLRTAYRKLITAH